MLKSKKHFFVNLVQVLLVAFMVISSGITSFVRVKAEEDEVGLDYSFILKLDGNEIKESDKPVLKNGSLLDGEIHFNLSNLKSGTGEDVIKEIPLEVSGIDIQTTGGGDIYDDNNEYAGTYTFEDGKIIITIDGDYRNTHSDIEGKLNFNGKLSLNSTDLKDGDETQISIGDQSWNITYSDGKKSGTGSVYKNTSGSVYKEGDSYYQDYEISLDCTNVWESNGITFKQGTYVDDLGDNLQLDGTIKVMNQDGTYSEYGSFDEIPDITLNSSFSQTKFKYRAKLLNVDTLSDVFNIENDDSYKNGFAANYNDGENNNKVENKDKVSVNVVKPSVDKSGKLSDDQNSLSWTITINVGSYKGSFTNLNEIVSNISDTSVSGGFTVPALSVDDFIENPAGSGIYTYTYETPVTNLDSTKLGFVYVNTVDITLDGQDYKSTANVKKNIDPDLKLLDKQLQDVNYENKTFTWAVDVTFYEGMKSVSLEDKVFGDGHHDTQEIYWNDVKLVEKGSDEKSVVTKEGKNILDEGKKYYTEYYEHTLYFSDTFVNAHLGETLHFTYVTTVDKFENLNEYSNKAALKYLFNGNGYSSEKSASYIYKVRTTKTGEVDSQENKINYTVDFDLKDLANLEAGKTVELEDHLSTDKFKIDPVSVKYYFNVKWDQWNAYNENSVVVQGTFDEDSSIFKIQVTQQMIDFINTHPAVLATRIRVTYSAIPKDLKEFYKDSKEQSQVVENTVTSRYDGNEIEKTTSTEEIQTKSLVSKTGWIKNGDIVNSYATFEVVVNPNGIQLNGGKSLKATDKMNLNLSYLDNSLKIFNTKDNTELSKDKYSYQWDEGTNSLQFELPDETPMKITYKAILNVPTGTTLDESNSKNTFTLFSTDNAASNQSEAYLTGIFIPNASISGETAELDIFKYTKVEGTDLPLANAKFSIYEYGKEEPVSFQNKTVFTTKENGYAIVRLLKDKIYELKEVEAPEGYSKDTASKYFVFKGNDFNKLTLPENTTVFDENNKVNNTIVGTIHVENQLQRDEKGQLVIEKVSDGATTPDSTKFIITGPDNYYTEVTYASFRDGKWVAEGLPLGDYTITEDTTSAAINKKTLNVKVEKDGAYVAGNSTSVKIENGKSSVAKFKNTYADVKTSFTVNKIWKDNNNENQRRPEYVIVHLLRNGDVYGDQVTLNETNNWTYTWSDLDKYDSDGNEIAYSVTETPVDGYTTSINGGEITNTVTRVNVSKVDSADLHVVTGAHLQVLDGTSVVDEWDSADSVHEILGLKVGTEYKLHETAAPSGYKLASAITFKIKSNGKVESAGNVDENGTLLMKDEQIAKTSYTVEKEWDDNDNAKGRRPESIVVHLLKNGDVYGDPVTLSAENNWTNTWSDLDATNSNNQPYTYSVSEDSVEHYNESSSTNGNNIVLTNTYVDNSKIVKIAKTDVNGNLLGGAVLSVKDMVGNIVASWTSVKGEEKELSLEPGKYTLREESAPAGYELASNIEFEVTDDGSVKVNGNVVSRVSMQDEKTKTSFTVNKNWADHDNAKGKRPDSVEVQLKNRDKVVSSVMLNTGNGWTYTWSDLDKYDSDGNEIAYSVTETPVDGYTTSISGGEITNTLDEGELKLTKTITGLPDTVEKKI